MTAQITRLDAAALRALGMDRVMVDALLNMVRVTGTSNDGPTVPQVGEKVDETAELVGALQERVAVIQQLIDLLSTSPAPIPLDPAAFHPFAIQPVQQTVPETVHIVTEVRQIAEEVASLREYLQTEVRQIAEQQAVTARLIQDIQLGKPL